MNDMLKDVVKQFRKIVTIYARETKITKHEAAELILPAILKAIETRLKESIK